MELAVVFLVLPQNISRTSNAILKLQKLSRLIVFSISNEWQYLCQVASDKRHLSEEYYYMYMFDYSNAICLRYICQGLDVCLDVCISYCEIGLIFQGSERCSDNMVIQKGLANFIGGRRFARSRVRRLPLPSGWLPTTQGWSVASARTAARHRFAPSSPPRCAGVTSWCRVYGSEGNPRRVQSRRLASRACERASVRTCERSVIR